MCLILAWVEGRLQKPTSLEPCLYLVCHKNCQFELSHNLSWYYKYWTLEVSSIYCLISGKKYGCLKPWAPRENEKQQSVKCMTTAETFRQFYQVVSFLLWWMYMKNMLNVYFSRNSITSDLYNYLSTICNYLANSRQL